MDCTVYELQDQIGDRSPIAHGVGAFPRNEPVDKSLLVILKQLFGEVLSGRVVDLRAFQKRRWESTTPQGAFMDDANGIGKGEMRRSNLGAAGECASSCKEAHIRLA